MVSLKKRAVSGVFFLGIKRIVIQFILTGGNIILARLLFPEVFGIYAIALGIVSLMSVFAGIGLEAALLQKKKEPEPEELRTVFTISLALASFVAGLIILLAPFLYRFYQEQLTTEGVLYLRLLSLLLVIPVFKGISALLLERRLDYARVVIGETLEIFITQLVTIILALKGFGVLSFILGVLIGRLLAAVAFFVLAPWPIGFKFSLTPIKGLLSFGINFQLNTIIGGLNGAVVPVFVGMVSGSTAVGFLNWALGVASFPRAVTDILGRLVFPVCARIQEDKRLLKQVIEKLVQLACLVSFPQVVILAALALPVTDLIYTSKWRPGIPALYLFSLQSVFTIIGLFFTQALFALGEAKRARNISLFWTILQWVLTVPLVLKFGFIGLPIASVLVSSTFFIPLHFLRQRVPLTIGSHVWFYLIYSLIAAGTILVINQRYPIKSIFELLLTALVGGLVYLALIFIFRRKEIIEDVARVKRALLE